MFSKQASSSLSPTTNWLKKLNPTDIPEHNNSTQTNLNVNSLPFSKRTKIRNSNRKRKAVLSPPPSKFVDLSGDQEITTKKSSETSTTSTTTVSRKDQSISMSSSSSAERHRRRSKFRVPSRRTAPPKPIEIIDLTRPSSIETIRKENELYFSYDPRGVDNDHELPTGYCQKCRCPDVYCAEKMFGKYLYLLMEKQISRLGFEYYEKEKDILWDFSTHYVNLLEMKVCFNNISLGEYRLESHTIMPMCINQGSYKKLLDDLKLWKHRDHEVMEFVNDDEIEMGLPPLLKRQDSGSDDDSYNNGPPSLHASPLKRTAIEQSADIGASFRAMKEKVSSKGKNAMRVFNPYKK
jgi:hypothetical protein